MVLSLATDELNFQNDKFLSQIVKKSRLPLCISNPRIEDNPVVFVNQSFIELTGFTMDEIIGRNCRFLQGRGTSKADIEKVRNIINDKAVDTVEIVNYKKDGTEFFNSLQVGPIFDDFGDVVYFFGSQLDVSDARRIEQEARDLADREIVHRIKNITNIMNVMISMTARLEKDSDIFARKIAGRLFAITEANCNTILRGAKFDSYFSELTKAIVIPYAPFGEKQLVIRGEDVLIGQHMVSTIALVLHELAINAVKHGALSVEAGIVEVVCHPFPLDDRLGMRAEWTELNGPAVVPPRRRGGSNIIETLIRSSGGNIHFGWQPEGLIAKIEFPTIQ